MDRDVNVYSKQRAENSVYRKTRFAAFSVTERGGVEIKRRLC